MKIYNKKNNICLAFVFLIGFVFSESLFAVRRRGVNRHKGHERTIDDSSVDEEYLTHLGSEFIRLKREGKNDIEIRVHINTVVLMRLFRRNLFDESSFLLRDENFIVENLMLDLYTLGKSKEEVKSYLDTIYLIKSFRSTYTTELDDLIKEAKALGSPEVERFFINVQSEISSKRNNLKKENFLEDFENLLCRIATNLWSKIF